MKKIVRKIGDSLGIIFNREERKIYDIRIDKILDLSLKDIKKEVKKK